MMAILLLISGVISISLILSGLIVLLVPHNKKRSEKSVHFKSTVLRSGNGRKPPLLPPLLKRNAPQTLSEALGIDKIEVNTLEPERIEPAPEDPVQIEPVRTETVQTKLVQTPETPQYPAVSAEQIKQLITNQEILIALVNGVQKMNNTRKDEQIVKTAKNLFPTIENFESAQSWLFVKPYIETVYPDFFNKLNTAAASARTPVEENLTDFEIRVCLLQLFDFSSKEIARITNRSARTIETTVYKIRKKLLVPTETRLPDFLKNLLI
ncbi:MAG: sigma-70 region 4 domain-containing protein [Bacteroidales bacterium]|jgi:DNA-binding CsgD family transcriptional regulator|nr:sigma-70 region 4 domain-containing protein [Bacteroidales bacterium]